MTTGRINQVTILYAGPCWEPKPSTPRPRHNPPEGGQKVVIHQVGTASTWWKTRPTGDRHRPREEAAVHNGHPIAPTEFPKRWSAATTRSVPGGNNHEAVTYTPQEEDTKGRSHRRCDGYRPRLTPRNLNENLSQGPFIHRPHPHRGAYSIPDFGQSFTP
jgi:hypothetical protein